jgi:alkyldihydroxyacetonephosphate synthase
VIELDRESLLVHVDATVPLAHLEATLARDGLTLDVADLGKSTVGAWIESGAPGARSAWLDPADHLVAGFSARIRATQASFVIRPAPRRAVGPDLAALVLGMHGRFLALESVWLRVHRVGTTRPSTEKFEDDAQPLNDDECKLLDAIAAALE